MVDTRDIEEACVDISILDGIRALQSDAAPDVLKELIDLYLKDSKAHMERVSLAFSNKDEVLLRRSLHSLKGISGNLGAMRFSNYCHELNSLIDQTTLAKLESWLPKLQQEHERVCEVLRAERDE